MAKKKGRGKLRGIVEIALVLSVLMLGLTPLANAAITSFTITPDTCQSCEMTTYTVQVTSDMPWHWQNTTIPAGVFVVAPTTGGVQIVRTDFWNGSGYVGYVTIKSNGTNPSSKVDVEAQVLGDSALSLGVPVTYAPGGTFIIPSPLPGGAAMLQVRWPTDTEEGYANVSVPGLLLQNITDVYKIGLCCPEPGERFWFHATAESDPVGMYDSVVCSAQVPVYNTLGVATLVGIMCVVLGFATARRKK